MITPDYLTTAFDLFELVGCLMCLESWQRFTKDQSKERSSALTEHQYDNLVEARWFAAEGLGSWAISKGGLDFSSMLVVRINRWLAIKRQGRWSEIEKEIRDFDHKALLPRFVVGIRALTEDMDPLFSLLPKAEIGEANLRNWPILEEARKILVLRKVLREIAKAPEAIAGVPTSVKA